MAGLGGVCYKQAMRDVREWIQEKMRRLPRRGPNDSESTGKIGQELPQNQQAPLRPVYPEARAAAEPEPAVSESLEAVAGVGDHAGTSSLAPETQRAQALDAPVRESSPAVPIAPPMQADGSERPVAEPSAAEPSRAAELSGPEPPAPEPERKIVVETQPEFLSTPPAEAVAAKSVRGYVVLTIGLPGSGKTTWYKRRGVTPLSSDLLRTILFDDITEQRYQGLVFSTLRSLLRARLIAKMPWNYVDATNLSPHERRQWIKMAKSFGYEVQAVFFDVPLPVCMERNSKRERAVTDEVMQQMAGRLRPPTFKEGFEKITVVRVKGQPGTEPVAGLAGVDATAPDLAGPDLVGPEAGA